MYDIEIIVPAELNSDQINIRLKDFKKLGFVNAEDFTIKLYFLASNDNNPEDLKKLCSNWPSNFDVEGVITPYKHVPQRIMHYYCAIMHPDTAKWYARIDEDTRTDIAGLMKNMNKWFDHERDYHVVGEISKEIDDIEYRILTEIGYDWYDGIQGYDLTTAPVHEIEMSLTSNSAVKRILANKPSMDLLNLRKEFGDGHGDMTFAFAARLVKIYPTTVQFITRHPRAIEFSLYDGQYNHFHDISRDRHPEYLLWLDITEEYNNPQLEEKLKNNSYYLNYKDHISNIWIKFLDKKRIIKINPRCVPEWSHKQETIGLWGFDSNGNLCTFINDCPLTLSTTSFGFDSEKIKITIANALSQKIML